MREVRGMERLPFLPTPAAIILNGMRDDNPPPGLVLQLHFMKVSESMGNHDSNVVDACCVD